MRYQIISAQSLHQLEVSVNVELSHDWQITGGLITFTMPADEMLNQPAQVFAQAMIRPGPAPALPT